MFNYNLLTYKPLVYVNEIWLPFVLQPVINYVLVCLYVYIFITILWVSKIALPLLSETNQIGLILVAKLSLRQSSIFAMLDRGDFYIVMTQYISLYVDVYSRLYYTLLYILHNWSVFTLYSLFCEYNSASILIYLFWYLYPLIFISFDIASLILSLSLNYSFFVLPHKYSMKGLGT